MRLCLYNPHAIQAVLSKTLISVLTDPEQIRSTRITKYKLLFDQINQKDLTCALVVDQTGSSIFTSTIKFKYNFFTKIFLSFFSYFEFCLWCLLNHLNPLKLKIIFSSKQLNPKTDILLSFPHLTNTFFDRSATKASIFYHYHGPKIIHPTHYFINTKVVSRNVRLCSPKAAIAESDLKTNKYFHKYYPFIKSFIIFPNVVRDRYQKITDFQTRIPRCLAIGSLTIFDKNSSLADFVNFFKTDTLHPTRKEILHRAGSLHDFIDSSITLTSVKTPKSYQNWFLYKVFRFILKPAISGKEYHGFDIVQKYNQYQMFVSPEEVLGLPSINFVEGIACGCAYIGLKSPIYTDIGLKDKFNYVAYNGTIKDLVDKIKHYRSHPEELQIIAQNGYDFITHNFSRSVLISKLKRNLENLI